MKKKILYLFNFTFEEYVHTFLTSKIKSVIFFVKLLPCILQNIFKGKVFLLSFFFFVFHERFVKNTCTFFDVKDKLKDDLFRFFEHFKQITALEHK